MSIALLGVLAMQYYFIRESYRLKSQLFDQSVNEALKIVAQKHEKRDAQIFEKDLAKKRYNALQRQAKLIRQKEHLKQLIPAVNQFKIQKEKIDRDFKIRDSLFRLRFPRAIPVESDFYETYMKEPTDLEKIVLNIQVQQSVDALGRVFTGENLDFWYSGDKKSIRRGSKDTVYYLIQDENAKLSVYALPRINARLKLTVTDEPVRQVKKVNKYLDSLQSLRQKTAVFAELANEYMQAKKPLRERINTADVYFINELLKEELFNLGVNLPYNAALKYSNSDSVIFTQVSDSDENFRNYNTYHTNLFPSEVINNAALLTITFPGKSNFMVHNIAAVLGSSFALLLVVIGCFSYTVFIIFRQKKIADMKNDFINNMTHEFKTPVATIMIASEALKDPEVVEDRRRVDKLAGIIYDENVRLGNHIERVLNIAKIDRGNLRLDLEPVNMHDLIEAVADSMSLQLQKKHAVVELKLNAERNIVTGDEHHLSNVVFNLIDNAVKYSKDLPYITISTYNTSGKLIICVTDKGIGMSKDQISKIFEQFYRIPTGNLHDVKGFGLGLSYVNNIVKRLAGSIKVKSEKDKGSEFEIILPIA